MSKERNVTVAEVKELLTKEYERRLKLEEKDKPAVEYTEPQIGEDGQPIVAEDTTYKQVQRDAMAHAEATSRIDKENAANLVKELEGLSFDDPNIAVAMKSTGISCKIADFLPKYPEDIRAIFSKERVKLEAGDIAKIIDTVKKYQ